MDIASSLTNPILSTPVPAYFVLGPLLVLLIMLVTLLVKRSNQTVLVTPVATPVSIPVQNQMLMQDRIPSGPASQIVQAMQQSQVPQAIPQQVQLQQPVIQQYQPQQVPLQPQNAQIVSQVPSSPVAPPLQAEEAITGYVAIEKPAPAPVLAPQGSLPPVNSWRPAPTPAFVGEVSGRSEVEMQADAAIAAGGRMVPVVGEVESNTTQTPS